jgi:cupin 2 domain-containing protein
MEIHNISSAVPSVLSEELFTLLLEGSRFRLERIISRGHATPEGEWLEQSEHEWVILLYGSAGLLFAGESAPRVLHTGDYLHIPAIGSPGLTRWKTLYGWPSTIGKSE